MELQSLLCDHREVPCCEKERWSLMNWNMVIKELVFEKRSNRGLLSFRVSVGPSSIVFFGYITWFVLLKDVLEMLKRDISKDIKIVVWFLEDWWEIALKVSCSRVCLVSDTSCEFGHIFSTVTPNSDPFSPAVSYACFCSCNLVSYFPGLVYYSIVDSKLWSWKQGRLVVMQGKGHFTSNEVITALFVFDIFW